jgi:hypothetical protein
MQTLPPANWDQLPLLVVPIWQSFAAWARPFLNSRVSGSVLEVWVALPRFSPWTLRSVLRPLLVAA